MSESTHWLPGIITFVVGLSVGLWALFWSRKKPAAAPAKPASVEASHSLRYQAALRALRELEDNRSRQTDAVYAAEKRSLEQEAVAALQAMDAAQAAAPERPSPATPPAAAAAPQRQWVGAALSLAVLAAAVGLSVDALFKNSKPKADEAGASMGAENAQAMAPAIPQSLREAMAALEARPNDVEALLRASVELMHAEMFENAAPLVRRAMEADCFDPRVRVLSEVLRAAQLGNPEPLGNIERLADTYPEAFEGHLYSAMIHLELKQNQPALDRLHRYTAQAPGDAQPGFVGELLAHLENLPDSTP